MNVAPGAVDVVALAVEHGVAAGDPLQVHRCKLAKTLEKVGRESYGVYLRTNEGWPASWKVPFQEAEARGLTYGLDYIFLGIALAFEDRSSTMVSRVYWKDTSLFEHRGRGIHPFWRTAPGDVGRMFRTVQENLLIGERTKGRRLGRVVESLENELQVFSGLRGMAVGNPTLAGCIGQANAQVAGGDDDSDSDSD